MNNHFSRRVWTACAFLAVFCSLLYTVKGDTLEEQISASEAFPEPLIWVGSQASTETESQDLLTIITNFPSATWKQDLLNYVSGHTNSPWVPSVRANLALMCRQSGGYSGALAQWETAWQATKNYTNGNGKAVGDSVLAHWSQLLASLGRTNRLKPLFDETAGRTLDKIDHHERLRGAQEGFMTMVDYPGLV